MLWSPGMSVELLTNHGHVLLCVARDRDMRLRDIADCVGITERAAHRIVCELEEAGFLTRHRAGRGAADEGQRAARRRAGRPRPPPPPPRGAAQPLRGASRRADAPRAGT